MTRIQKTCRKAASRLRNSAGFTMAEMLIVIAITGILAGFGFVAFNKYQSKMTLRQYNDSAKQIFIAAQNHMAAAKEDGTWDRLYKDTIEGQLPSDYASLDDSQKASKLEEIEKSEAITKIFGTQMTKKPSDFPANAESNINSGWDSDTHDFRYFVLNPKSASIFVKTSLKYMLPYGSIDEVVRTGGYYVIEYDAKSASVYSVFFTADERGIDYNDVLVLDGNKARAYEDKEMNQAAEDYRQMSFKKGSENAPMIVGYYGGTEALSLTRTNLEAPYDLNINNDERLTLTFTDVNYFRSVNAQDENGHFYTQAVQATPVVKVTGMTSGAVKTMRLSTTPPAGTGAPQKNSNLVSGSEQAWYNTAFAQPEIVDNPMRDKDDVSSELPAKAVKYTLYLDAIDIEGGHFAQLFSTVDPGATAEFVPGENLSITVSLETTRVLANISSSATKGNSLFGSVTPDSTKAEDSDVANGNKLPVVATIANGRNLENLDPVISGINDDEGKTKKTYVTKAEITESMNWKSDWQDFYGTVTDINLKMASVFGKTPLYIYDKSNSILNDDSRYVGVVNRTLESLNGNNNSLRGFDIMANASGNAGLLASVERPFTVKNLAMISPRVEATGDGYAGAVVGLAGSEVADLNSLEMTGVAVAVLNEDAERDEYLEGAVNITSGEPVVGNGNHIRAYGNGAAGGLVGGVRNNTTAVVIDESYATIPVIAENGYAGGLIGDLQGAILAKVSNSFTGGHFLSLNNQITPHDSVMGVANTSTTSGGAGGLIGRTTLAPGITAVSDSYSWATLTGRNVGGIVGESNNATNTYSNVYAANHVTQLPALEDNEADNAFVGSFAGTYNGGITITGGAYVLGGMNAASIKPVGTNIAFDLIQTVTSSELKASFTADFGATSARENITVPLNGELISSRAHYDYFTNKNLAGYESLEGADHDTDTFAEYMQEHPFSAYVSNNAEDKTEDEKKASWEQQLRQEYKNIRSDGGFYVGDWVDTVKLTITKRIQITGTREVSTDEVLETLRSKAYFVVESDRMGRSQRIDMADFEQSVDESGDLILKYDLPVIAGQYTVTEHDYVVGGVDAKVTAVSGGRTFNSDRAEVNLTQDETISFTNAYSASDTSKQIGLYYYEIVGNPDGSDVRAYYDGYYTDVYSDPKDAASYVRDTNGLPRKEAIAGKVVLEDGYLILNERKPRNGTTGKDDPDARFAWRGGVSEKVWSSLPHVRTGTDDYADLLRSALGITQEQYGMQAVYLNNPKGSLYNDKSVDIQIGYKANEYNSDGTVKNNNSNKSWYYYGDNFTGGEFVYNPLYADSVIPRPLLNSDESYYSKDYREIRSAKQYTNWVKNNGPVNVLQTADLWFGKTVPYQTHEHSHGKSDEPIDMTGKYIFNRLGTLYTHYRGDSYVKGNQTKYVAINDIDKPMVNQVLGGSIANLTINHLHVDTNYDYAFVGEIWVTTAAGNVALQNIYLNDVSTARNGSALIKKNDWHLVIDNVVADGYEAAGNGFINENSGTIQNSEIRNAGTIAGEGWAEFNEGDLLNNIVSAVNIGGDGFIKYNNYNTIQNNTVNVSGTIGGNGFMSIGHGTITDNTVNAGNIAGYGFIENVDNITVDKAYIHVAGDIGTDDKPTAGFAKNIYTKNMISDVEIDVQGMIHGNGFAETIHQNAGVDGITLRDLKVTQNGFASVNNGTIQNVNLINLIQDVQDDDDDRYEYAGFVRYNREQNQNWGGEIQNVTIRNLKSNGAVGFVTENRGRITYAQIFPDVDEAAKNPVFKAMITVPEGQTSDSYGLVSIEPEDKTVAGYAVGFVAFNCGDVENSSITGTITAADAYGFFYQNGAYKMRYRTLLVDLKGNIKNSYANVILKARTGDGTAADPAGSAAGFGAKYVQGLISNNHSTGKITATKVAGFIFDVGDSLPSDIGENNNYIEKNYAAIWEVDTGSYVKTGTTPVIKKGAWYPFAKPSDEMAKATNEISTSWAGVRYAQNRSNYYLQPVTKADHFYETDNVIDFIWHIWFINIPLTDASMAEPLTGAQLADTKTYRGLGQAYGEKFTGETVKYNQFNPKLMVTKFYPYPMGAADKFNEHFNAYGDWGTGLSIFDKNGDSRENDPEAR